jgi:hypothetical protein
MNPTNPHRLRAVRISAFCIFLVIFVPMALMYGSLLTHYDPVDSSGERLHLGLPCAKRGTFEKPERFNDRAKKISTSLQWSSREDWAVSGKRGRAQY